MNSTYFPEEHHIMPVQRYLFVSHQWEEQNKTLLICLKGHLDYHAVHILRHCLDELRKEVSQALIITFDFKNLTKLDESGIGFLLVLFHKLNGHNQKLVIQNIPAVFHIDLKQSPLAACIPIKF